MLINRERLFMRFMEFCAIDSQSLQERLLADRLKELLVELGFEVTEDDAGEKAGGNCGNVIGRLRGTAEGPPVLFSCHMDRVVPGTGIKPRVEGDYIVSDGTTILGADDAAGLSAVIEAATTLRERQIPHPTIEVVFTIAEELALLGSMYFDTSRVESRSAFILDAGGRVGEIVVQAPEQVKIEAVFHGRSAHAGFCPEQGASAIQMAGVAISRMKLLRIDPETTANIGSITATGPTNIVPDRCELRAETRSLDSVKVQAQVTAMTEAMRSAAAEFGGSVDISTSSCYTAYRIPEDAEVAQRAARAAQRVGLQVAFKSTGGGSDANIFNGRGLASVVLGCGYEKVHTTEERMPLDQLALLAEWTLALATDGSTVA